MLQDKTNNRIVIWLLSGCFLIFSMVVIGGITRLTGSGLSITEWNVIMGTLPPMNQQEWEIAFEKYRQIPQYTEVNSYFSLEDFKAIFWWEYIHRLVGRLIGIVFIIPFLWFLFTRQFDRTMLKKALFLFLLGGLQGFLGWFMVKSGLAERTSVSHIRLAIHLCTAFITFGFTFWFALQLLEPPAAGPDRQYVRRLSVVFLFVLGLQLAYGAFVAGLHAGKMYNTFPLMNGQVLPDSAWMSDWGASNLIENPGMVQWVHRFLAFTLVFLASWILISSRGSGSTISQRTAVRFLAAAIGLQFILGMLTVLYHAPIFLSSVHQIGAFFLFASALLLVFRFRKTA
ncbi:MAG: hypothetical protein RL021_1274 [Bacteroidota bacterium]|jgi:cytochrome c oxidase assembly protein subunit 15